MKIKYTILFLGLLILGALNSCQKIPGHQIQPGSGIGNSGGTGSTGGTGGTGGSTTGTYSPVTAGTNWVYKSVSGTYVDTLNYTMAGSTTTINSKLYSVVNLVSAKTGNSTGYFAAIKHVYTLAQSIPTTTDILEMQYLIDNAAVGTTWTTPASPTGTINGVPARISGKITEVGISKTVTGMVFNNVIHSTILLQYDYGLGYQTSGTYEYYVAQNVGVIEIDSSISSFGASVTGVNSLLSYKIK